MNCPKCGLRFQIWEKDCLACGINFLEYLEERAAAPKPEPKEPSEPEAAEGPARPEGPAGAGRRPAPRRRRTGARAVLAAAVSATVAIGIAAALREPLPPGAFHDAEAELAFVPPPGWKVTTGLGSGWRFKSVARLSGDGGRIEIELAPKGIPVERHLEDLLREEFSGRRIEFRQASAIRIADADGRRLAFRAAGGALAAGIRGEAVFFPGAPHNYLLRFYSEAGSFARANAGWNCVLASARIVRPPLAFLRARRD